MGTAKELDYLFGLHEAKEVVNGYNIYNVVSRNLELHAVVSCVDSRLCLTEDCPVHNSTSQSHGGARWRITYALLCSYTRMHMSIGEHHCSQHSGQATTCSLTSHAEDVVCYQTNIEGSTLPTTYTRPSRTSVAVITTSPFTTRIVNEW